MDFKDKLKQLRKDSKLSQSEFGKLFNLSGNAIGCYERGEREPSIELLNEISKKFDLSMDYLVGDKPKKRRKDDVGSKIIDIEKDLSNFKELQFLGTDLDDTTRELLIDSLRQAIKIAKVTSMKKKGEF